MNNDNLITGKKRILVAEDELIIAKGIEKRLSALGYDVVDIVPSGEEAVTKALATIPDLVLMDICLQGEMDGITAAEKIRSEVDIPVIYLTAFADSDTLARAKITEPFGYIVKPFQDVTLQSAIEMALYKHMMESRLRRNEQWLATILKSVGDAVIATDNRGAITFMNPTAEELTGWRGEEAVGRGLEEVFRIREEGQVPSVANIVSKVIRNGAVVNFLGRTFLQARDGREIPIEAKATPFAGAHGEHSGLALAFLDISKRIRTEDALRRSERLLSVKNQIANVFLAVPDEDMYKEVLDLIIGVMESGYGLFGYIDESGNLVLPSLTSNFWEECRVHEKSIVFPRDAWGGLWGRALKEKRSFLSNSKFEVPQGHVAVDNFLTVPILYRGESIGLVSVANKKGGYDESDRELLESLVSRIAPILAARLQRDKEERERKQMEEALAAEKERLAVTLRSIGEGVITTDTDGRIVLLNKAAEKMTGWRQEEAAGRPFNEVFFIVNEKTRQPCDNPAAKVLSAGAVLELENHTILIVRDGRERVISYSGAPIHDPESRLIGAVLVFRDVTEKRKMEQELIKARQLDSIGILAGGIAHDFNNLLTAILGNISIAKIHTAEGDNLHRKLVEAEKASLRARDLAQQLLTFSRGGAPVKKSARIADIIKESVAFTLSGSRTTCRFEIGDDLWPVEVDPGQISQVINNLIINADQAMPEGGTIEVACKNVCVESEDLLPISNGRYIMISIRDHGAGIPPDSLGRIFDPYYTTKANGKGLGLSTVYSIIRNHDGHIKVTSAVGEGTAFTLYLPCALAAADEPAVNKDSAGEPRRPAPSGKILVMDDEEIIRDLAEGMLDFLGYEAELAEDGAGAVALYKKSLDAGEPFDAVLMDLTVPGGMGGKEALQILMELDSNVIAIASSGYSNDPIMADYRAFGFRGTISKPYQLEEFRCVLEEVLEEKRQ